MFRLLHTADWHIGKSLAGYDRTGEWEVFFQRLIKTIEVQSPDLMIVAGDVFDSATPSNVSANMYYNLIETLHTKFPTLKIVITSGNHDSQSYLNAPKEILHYFNAEVVGSVARDDDGICFEKMVIDLGGVIVCAVPYLRRGDVMSMGGENPSVSEFYRRMLDAAVKVRGGREIPIIGVGHLTTIGATYNKGIGNTIIATRDDSVGGLENIDPQDFPEDFSYIALGHIHRRQRAGGRENIWYSGAPIPMSFSEKDYPHSLSIVDFDGRKLSEIHTVELPHVVKLLRVPDKLSDFETVAAALQQLPDDEEMFIEVALSPEFRSPEIKARIINELLKNKKAKFCGFQLIGIMGGSIDGDDAPMSVEQLQTMDPMTVIADIYQSRMHTQLSDRHADMLRTIIDEITET